MTQQCAHTLTVRAAGPADGSTLRRLAELDSSRPLHGSVLLAERGAVPLAAIALSSGVVIADPFNYTEAAVRLLRRRRYELVGQGGDVGRARSLLRRLAPAA